MFWCVHFLSRPSGIKVSLTSGVCLGCCGFVLKMPPPVVLVNDTPCGFARHLDLREPTVGSQLWGDCMGCFEKPSLETEPKQVKDSLKFIP